MHPQPPPLRLNTLPPDLLSRILAWLPAGSIDALSAAAVSSCLLSTLVSLSSITSASPTVPTATLAATLTPPVGAHIRELNVGFHCAPLSSHSLRSIASSCANLRALTLYGIQSSAGLTDGSFRALLSGCPDGTCRQLEDIRIEFCGGLTGNSLVAAASSCPSLRRVTFKFAGPVTNAHIASVATLTGPHLTELELECSPSIGDPALLALAAHCPNLSLLGVAACSGITDVGLLAIAAALGDSLLALDIHGAPRISDLGLYHLASHCHSLEYLNVWRVCLTSYAIRAVAETSGDTLRVLVMGDCIGIDDAALRGLADHCSVLDELEMPGLPNVTDAGMAALLNAAAGPPLSSLSIDRCKRLTDATLASITLCPALTEVSAVALPAVTRPGIAFVKAESPLLALSAEESPPSLGLCESDESSYDVDSDRGSVSSGGGADLGDDVIDDCSDFDYETYGYRYDDGTAT
jgi:hypothetical protein